MSRAFLLSIFNYFNFIYCVKCVGLPWWRVLPSLPPAGESSQDVWRHGQRLPHRPPRHWDPGTVYSQQADHWSCSRVQWPEPEPWNRGGSSSDLFWKKRNIQFLISVYKLIFPFKSEVPLLEELSKAHVPKISAITVIAAIC